MRKFFVGVSGLALSLGCAASAFAQAPVPAAQAPADGASAASAAQAAAPVASNTEVQAIVVTGTQIRGVAPVGAPVVSVSQADIQKSGLTSVTDVLRSVPQVVTIGADERASATAGSSGVGNTARGSGINLHGLGNVATLVLLDGHRLAPSGLQATFVDPSSIPTASLSAVEVLADGASATYGSDAVAGVVNFIFRKNWEGAQVYARYGFADGGYNLNKEGFGIGHRWDGGDISLFYEHSAHSMLLATDRPDLYPNAGAPMKQISGSAAPPTGYVNFTPLGNIRVGSTYYAVNPDGTVTPNAQNVQGTNSDVLQAQTRDSFVLRGDQELTNKLSVYGQGFYGRRTGHGYAPYTLTSLTLTVPNTNPYFKVIPGVTGATETVATFQPISQAANQNMTDQVDWQTVLGARYQLPYEWQADASFESVEDIGLLRTVSSVYNNCALTGGASCATNGAAISQTSPSLAFNPFGPNTNLLSSLTTDWGKQRSQYRIDIGNVKFDGPLFSLPAGAVRAAVGAEYAHHDYNFVNYQGPQAPRPGTYNVLGDVSSMNVASVFGEVTIPVVGPDNAMPGVRKLNLDAAVRYDKYSRLSEGTTNPKVGASWVPVDDLTVRTSYGTSFRYTLTNSDYYNARRVSFATNTADYLSPTGTTTSATYGGGNPDIKPETAKTFTFGANYKPSWLRGLNLDVSYFKVNYTNIIANPNPSIATAADAALYSSYITRRPAASDVAGNAAFNAQVQTLLNSPFLISGTVPVSAVNVIINSNDSNVGSLDVNGLDFGAQYRWTMRDIDFNVGTAGTYYFKYLRSVIPGGPQVERVSQSGYPTQYRLRSQIEANWNGLTGALFWNYTPGYADINIVPYTHVADYSTFDLALAYDTGSRFQNPALKNIRLSIDVQDLFHRKPPYFYSGTSGVTNYDPGVVNPVGRTVAFQITKDW
jgi:iron complex outermembrane receptor protein